MAKFLNKSITDEQVKKLPTFLEFSNRSKDEINRLGGMQSSGLINAKGLEERGFMRKGPCLTNITFSQAKYDTYIYIFLAGNFFIGEAGDWKNHFSPQLNEEIDQWIEQNLAESDLKFVSQISHQKE